MMSTNSMVNPKTVDIYLSPKKVAVVPFISGNMNPQDVIMGKESLKELYVAANRNATFQAFKDKIVRYAADGLPVLLHTTNNNLSRAEARRVIHNSGLGFEYGISYDTSKKNKVRTISRLFLTVEDLAAVLSEWKKITIKKLDDDGRVKSQSSLRRLLYKMVLLSTSGQYKKYAIVKLPKEYIELIIHIILAKKGVLMVVAADNQIGKCTVSCRNATYNICVCSCAGLNHGVHRRGEDRLNIVPEYIGGLSFKAQWELYGGESKNYVTVNLLTHPSLTSHEKGIFVMKDHNDNVIQYWLKIDKEQ